MRAPPTLSAAAVPASSAIRPTAHALAIAPRLLAYSGLSPLVPGGPAVAEAYALATGDGLFSPRAWNVAQRRRYRRKSTMAAITVPHRRPTGAVAKAYRGHGMLSASARAGPNRNPLGTGVPRSRTTPRLIIADSSPPSPTPSAATSAAR